MVHALFYLAPKPIFYAKDMASICLSLTRPLVTTSSPTAPSIRITSPTKQQQAGFTHRFACKASSTSSSEGTTGHDNQQTTKFERREMLIGLGGLYGVAGLTSDSFAASEPKANGTGPIVTPNPTTCNLQLKDPPEFTTVPPNVNCCPPTTSTSIIDFTIPEFSCTRMRRAAHNLDTDYICKYQTAVAAMRNLPDDDPRSWTQQANVHCAYCNGGYDQSGNPSQYIQVHGCWLFFPFHRWYLYFHERILGSLICDPDFALPFWNWDSPDGYEIPSMFLNDPTTSALYDVNRNQNHLPPVQADLSYPSDEIGKPSTAKKRYNTAADNLSVMYKQMVDANTKTLFLGMPYAAGDNPNPGGGSLENGAHTAIHLWTGDSNRQKNGEDLGSFYSSGRDPLFYGHHANVDRLWNIWQKLPGGNRSNYTDPNFLDATFLFYDEKKQLVRVTVADSLDSTNLGYDYEDVDIPWTEGKPQPATSKLIRKVKKSLGVGVPHAAKKNIKPLSEFPITLDKTVSTIVRRPKKSRSKLEKEAEEEVLVVQGIDYDRSVPTKFDVYINDEDEDEPSRVDKAEFAGTFATVPQSKHPGAETKTNLNLGISSLLEDLGAEGDDTVVVTLVPKSGIGKIKIDGIKIEYLS